MSIVLPTSPTPGTDAAPECLVLYGPPKVGKTTICSDLPSHLLLDLEKGAGFVTATKLHLTNAAEIVEAEKLVLEASYPYKYVIADTLDCVEDYAERLATETYKKTIVGQNFKGESVLELPNGGGYLWLRNSFKHLFHTIRRMAPRSVFIGHIKDKMLTNDSRDVISKDLDLTGKVKNIVCSYSDAIGHIRRDDKGQIVISFKTAELLMCGSRCKHLGGKEIVFDKPTMRENWKQIYTDL